MVGELWLIKGDTNAVTFIYNKELRKTIRVDNRTEKIIGFIDKKPSRTTEQILKLMHDAYSQGILDGRKEKSNDIRIVLNV